MTLGGTLVHNEFKSRSVSCIHSLVVTNTPRTAKVLVSNLTASVLVSNPFCFLTLNIPVHENFGLLFVCYCFVGLVITSKNHSVLQQTSLTAIASSVKHFQIPPESNFVFHIYLSIIYLSIYLYLSILRLNVKVYRGFESFASIYDCRNLFSL